ncbi:hypothetical protein [Streptomyces sp. NPDC096132]|uniref:hypothetical protein n=1 Tax=Streptomyces sp. NPDC096132 TaxID=3366075 RepID=UPI0038008059
MPHQAKFALLWLSHEEKAKLLRLEQRAAHRKSFREPGERGSNRLHHTYDRIKPLKSRERTSRRRPG